MERDRDRDRRLETGRVRRCFKLLSEDRDRDRLCLGTRTGEGDRPSRGDPQDGDRLTGRAYGALRRVGGRDLLILVGGLGRHPLE